jgi:hypothetical protein
MPSIPDTRYVPIIRTRDAELRGIAQLSSRVLDAILPVVEYTKSRRTKLNVDGAVSKCVDRVSEILGERPYIADITTLASLQNGQVERLLDPENGFAHWCEFVNDVLPANVIPIVHLTDPFDSTAVRMQAQRLARKSGRLAIRIPPGYEHASDVVNLITGCVGDASALAVVVDAGFIARTEVESVAAQVASSFQALPARLGLKAAASSGFPSSVTLPGYGKDAYGLFPLAEVALSKLAQQLTSIVLTHGDYALVHPNDFEGVVTNWVPRIDVPLEESTFYHRYRRGDGGYERCAVEALKDPAYKPLSCWGHDNIRAAASGDLPGRSPAFWIANRVNFHISRQVDRLTQRTLFGRVSI